MNLLKEADLYYFRAETLLLNHDLQSELACRDEGLNLDKFIELAIGLDKRARISTRSDHFTFYSPPENTEPMQICHTHLTIEEKDRRIRERLCL